MQNSFVRGSTLLCLLLLVSGIACSTVTPPRRPDGLPSGNAGRLMDRPEFDLVRAASKAWCEDALLTINSLEARIQRLEARLNQVQ